MTRRLAVAGPADSPSGVGHVSSSYLVVRALQSPTRSWHRRRRGSGFKLPRSPPPSRGRATATVTGESDSGHRDSVAAVTGTSQQPTGPAPAGEPLNRQTETFQVSTPESEFRVKSARLGVTVR